MNGSWLWIAVVALFVSGEAVQGHGLGVLRGELDELQPGRHQLTLRLAGASGVEVSAPELPERFTLEPPDTLGRSDPSRVTYRFAAPEGSLHAEESLRLPDRFDGVMLTMRWLDGATVTSFFPAGPEGIDIELAALDARSRSVGVAAWRYFVIGIEHIWFGIDHLLFVVGLMLIVRGGWMLVKTITAFTVAHSVTLGLATFDLVELPSAPVEAVIALSIVFLAVEALRARRGRPGLSVRAPWVVALLFGLVHGLGFAGALAELGLPRPEIPLALLFFNLGVEFGQLVFVIAIVGVVWVVRRIRLPVPEWTPVVPTYAIGIVAAYWLWERSLGMVL